MSERMATKPNQAERPAKPDRIMEKLPVDRRRRIEARAAESGLQTNKARGGGKHPWRFRGHFRRAAFGWRGGRLAISRIDQALTEIRAEIRHDPALGAEGAILFLEKLSPALCQVDDSSGALGGAVRAAVEELVPPIAAAPVDEAVRDKWLERLYAALEEDDPPYLECLGAHLGVLCATPARAARDRRDEAPAFAADAALAALHWMAAGFGYELTNLDAIEARVRALDAATRLGQTEQVQQHIERILAGPGPAVAWLRKVLSTGR